jgi:hypothetical protein
MGGLKTQVAAYWLRSRASCIMWILTEGQRLSALRHPIIYWCCTGLPILEKHCVNAIQFLSSNLN